MKIAVIYTYPCLSFMDNHICRIFCICTLYYDSTKTRPFKNNKTFNTSAFLYVLLLMNYFAFKWLIFLIKWNFIIHRVLFIFTSMCRKIVFTFYLFSFRTKCALMKIPSSRKWTAQYDFYIWSDGFSLEY